MEERGQAQILIVEDELELLELIVFSIERIGHKAFPIDRGDEAIKLMAQESFDLVLLDVMLPGLSGQEICKKIRMFSDVPIIVISALGRTETVVEMLELGADEYITKPFSFQAFEAQIEAQLRRIQWTDPSNAYPLMSIGDLQLDTEQQIATLGKQRIQLSDRECSMLQCLLQHAGMPLTTHQLCEQIWGPKSNSKAKTLVQTTIQRLRNKIEENPSAPRRIVTVRGHGYKLQDAS